jgi:hypothetical protein
MNEGRTVFSQLMDFLPLSEFRRLVLKHRGDFRVRKLSCLDQFYIMAFAQLSYRESLRDIETFLRAAPSKPYHLGIRARVSRSTLADANEKRDSNLYANLAAVLIARAQRAYAGQPALLNLDRTVYAFDSSVIDLSLKLFPWGHFKKNCSGVKLHTLLNVASHIPSFVCITLAKVSDVSLLDQLIYEPGAVYVVDRGYLDYARLYRIDQARAFFVTRTKKRYRFRRVRSHPVEGQMGVRSDQRVRLVNPVPKKRYPDALRRIRFVDPETEKRLSFITNNFEWSALTIADLYKARWHVELFFKWIKQHLRIKAFFGTSLNAVKTQIWIALCVYLLLALIKKELQLSQSLHTIAQLFSLSLFQKVPLLELFTQTTSTNETSSSCKSLTLFEI